MNQLCLLSNLTSSEWAAWVQAIGAIAAIVGAAWIAIWQSRRQHAISLSVIREEHRLARTSLVQSLLALSTACARGMEFASRQFPDRETTHRIAMKEIHFDLGELQSIDNALSSIPLHSLPHGLVPLTMMLASTVRQFVAKIEGALKYQRGMDAAAFQDFFMSLAQMQQSLAKTREDIAAEVQRA